MLTVNRSPVTMRHSGAKVPRPVSNISTLSSPVALRSPNSPRQQHGRSNARHHTSGLLGVSYRLSEYSCGSSIGSRHSHQIRSDQIVHFRDIVSSAVQLQHAPAVAGLQVRQPDSCTASPAHATQHDGHAACGSISDSDGNKLTNSHIPQLNSSPVLLTVTAITLLCMACLPGSSYAAETLESVTDAASAAPFVPGPVEVGWEIWFGAFVGVVPFAIGAYEFAKRILIQRRCQNCSGSGLVQKGRFQRKCPECGGFFPWRGWGEFLSATAQPGNGGPLRQPKGQSSVFYKVPPKPDSTRKEDSDSDGDSNSKP